MTHLDHALDLAKEATERAEKAEERAVVAEQRVAELENACTVLSVLLSEARTKTPSSDRGCCETAYIEGRKQAWNDAHPTASVGVGEVEAGVAQKAREGSGESTPETAPAAVQAAVEQRSCKPPVPGSSPGPSLDPVSVPRPSEPELDSPNFVPKELDELAKRGYERVNAWPRTNEAPPEYRIPERIVVRGDSARKIAESCTDEAQTKLEKTVKDDYRPSYWRGFRDGRRVGAEGQAQRQQRPETALFDAYDRGWDAAIFVAAGALRKHAEYIGSRPEGESVAGHLEGAVPLVENLRRTTPTGGNDRG